MDDEVLEDKLMQQHRSRIPEVLDEARSAMERLLASALLRDMSPPEARVEATILRTQFENVAARHGATLREKAIRESILRDGLEEIFSDEEIRQILDQPMH